MSKGREAEKEQRKSREKAEKKQSKSRERAGEGGIPESYARLDASVERLLAVLCLPISLCFFSAFSLLSLCSYGTITPSTTCTIPFDARTEAMILASLMNVSPPFLWMVALVPSAIATTCPSLNWSTSSADVVT